MNTRPLTAGRSCGLRGTLAARGEKPPGLASPAPRRSRCSRGLLALAPLVAAGLVLPVTAASAVQDTVSNAGRGWVGIRFTPEAPPSAPAGPRSHGLLVAEVYRNSPADVVGIVPGDWFVSVNGNLLSTYETWLRSTSNLGIGQALLLRVVQSGREREVTVVADPAPAFIGPNPLDEFEVAVARFDSVFGAILEFPPLGEPWPWHGLSRVAFRGETGPDSGTLTVTFDARGITRVRARPDDETVVEVEAPPPAGGGGADVTGGVYRLHESRISVLVPRLLERTVLLGGVVVRDLPAELGPFFGAEAGVWVTDVFAMSPGLQAGFRAGDVIVAVEGKNFNGVSEFQDLLAELATPIVLTVIRRRNQVKITYPRPD